MTEIGPSLMCSDLGALREDIKILHEGNVDFFHFDIMDGHFVPNYTMGTDMIKSVRHDTNLPFDAHLMIEYPERYIDTFVECGCDMISIHEEATPHLHRTLQHMNSTGVRTGLALNPSTSLNSLEYVGDIVDYVVIMTVNPGFAGQTFIPSTLNKIENLKHFINSNNLQIKIQVDGNISYDIIPEVIRKGADMLVCGTSCLFKQPNGLKQSTADLRHFTDRLKVEQ
ncbi:MULTISPECIES: ribulose-phosphate 3-epimerase [Salibacterium]|uniref:Ribulose-phosphate 3-epimerase n=2 Tax=Salibacterium TaxID=1884429 RepID=A0A1I4I254_9BACI|nr:ribulose-phosphate 3-epimerase [Salibacterium qingdaonense]SFL48439.1 ribulose-phosphate 3-epimerase [Salibacterium qingdaonense]